MAKPGAAAERAETVAVLGLGYVGLPLAIHLARGVDVVGFDISRPRIAELAAGRDATGEVSSEALFNARRLSLTADPERLKAATVFIAAAPTPVDAENQPDLRALEHACRLIGAALKPGDLVVFESTVHPGVTEDICGPWLEQASGLKLGVDFGLGYSPERVNPGDKTHTVDKIVKVIAAQTPGDLARMRRLYSLVVGEDNLFAARDIRTAETAKAIENAQRDINIAFINEVTMICARLGLSVHDVLAAARTKWNFLPFQPGLVGGHCIGVDPYYLAACARAAGMEPDVILAGRRINDAMGDWLAVETAARLTLPGPVLVLGLTFKEDVPDLRNSKVADLIRGLEARGRAVLVHDPLADPIAARHEYGVELLADLSAARDCAGLVLAAPHRLYRDWPLAETARFLAPGGLIVDVKDVWRDQPTPEGLRRWRL